MTASCLTRVQQTVGPITPLYGIRPRGGSAGAAAASRAGSVPDQQDASERQSEALARVDRVQLLAGAFVAAHGRSAGPVLEPGLCVVFVGSSVGERSATIGHYYADATNKFWQLLIATGLTNNAGLTCGRDHELLMHRLGLTDVVKSVAASSNKRLRPSDFNAARCVSCIENYQPTVVAFHDVVAVRAGAREIGAHQTRPDIGPVPWEIANAQVYRLPSPSGQDVHMNGAEKTAA